MSVEFLNVTYSNEVVLLIGKNGSCIIIVKFDLSCLGLVEVVSLVTSDQPRAKQRNKKPQPSTRHFFVLLYLLIDPK